MTTSGAPLIESTSVVNLARGVRLKEDAVRGHTVLLAPERAISLDEIAVAIVQALDGVRTLEEIAAAFSLQFEAPKDQVLTDVLSFVREFANRRMLEIVG
jgi:pyrroloquinoline quinone biosynthesis protein D